MRVEDIAFEGGTGLQDLIAGYWHLKEGYEKALACTHPDCHHSLLSKEELQSGYDKQLAQICHQIVELIMEVA